MTHTHRFYTTIKHLLIICLFIMSSASALSKKHPTYISLGLGFAGSDKSISITTWKPKSNAVSPVDKVNTGSANFMAYESGTFAFKPNNGIGFSFSMGGVDVTNGVGLEGEFGYFSTSNKKPGLIAATLDETTGSTDNTTMSANTEAQVKFTNFKRASGLKSFRTTVNLIYFPMIQSGTEVYVGAGGGYSRTGIYYRRNADVQYKAADANGATTPSEFGAAARVNLGPQIEPSGWSAVLQGFLGIRMPFEPDSAFDIRVTLLQGYTKKIQSDLSGYQIASTDAADNITTASYKGMIQSAYVTPESDANLTIKDEASHEFNSVVTSISASFSPY